MTATLAPATALPDAAAKTAALLVATHQCIVCRTLPERPFDPADAEDDAEYRPEKPRATKVHGDELRCREHRVKLCGFCEKPITGDKRKNYHPECVAPMRERAKFSKRRCSRCRKTRAASKFSNDPTRADGKFPWCTSCQAEHGKSRRFQDAEDELNGHVCSACDTPVRGHKNRRFCSTSCADQVARLRRNFNLTIEQYRAMIAATGGRCPLCDCRPKMWAVDHDHRTGLVTGVVCTGCNVQLLAASKHDPARVRRLLDYLLNTPAAQLGIVAVAPEGRHKPSKIHKMWQHSAVPVPTEEKTA